MLDQPDRSGSFPSNFVSSYVRILEFSVLGIVYRSRMHFHGVLPPDSSLAPDPSPMVRRPDDLRATFHDPSPFAKECLGDLPVHRIPWVTPYKYAIVFL